MMVLVYAHRLECGGTQVNAIELGEALRDRHGCEVVFFAAPGPMQAVLESKGLRFLPAPAARFHPSPRRMKALRAAVRAERPDVLHVWDWWQCLDAHAAVHLGLGVPMLVTDMMMERTRLLPRHVPTTYGTAQIAAEARAAGHAASLLLPPVDVHANAPDASDGIAFRHGLGVADDRLVIVTVSRLSEHMKSESLQRTIDAVGQLGGVLPLEFLIVGDGQARARLQREADRVNAALGRTAVRLLGELVDPRPAYAAADLVVGMGGSALRAMAFAKPVIVVGEAGYARLFDAGSAPVFLRQGLYGHGDGDVGNAGFVALLAGLARQRSRFASLGAAARQFVEANHAIEVVSDQLVRGLRHAVAAPPGRLADLADALRMTLVYLRERRFLTPSADAVPRRADAVRLPPRAEAGAAGAVRRPPTSS